MHREARAIESRHVMHDTHNVQEMLGNEYLGNYLQKSSNHSRQPPVTAQSMDVARGTSSKPYSPQAIMSFRPKYSDENTSHY